MLTDLLLFALSELATVESIATLFLYAAMGAGWAYVGYRRNRAARNEAWDAKKARSTFIAGAVVGLAVVLSGHTFESGHVMAVAGFLVPLIDKLWNAATKATETTASMAKEGASIPEIALEVAEIVDREVDIEDAAAIVAEYERRFGTLEPDPEHVKERAREVKSDYETGGPDEVYDRFGPEEAVEEMDGAAKPDRRTIASQPTERSYIVEGPVVGPDPDLGSDLDSDSDSDSDLDTGGGDGDGDGESGEDGTNDETIHESA